MAGDLVLKAVVTGAASGIGFAISELLRNRGWEVCGIDLHAGGGIVAADVSDPEAMEAAARQIGDGPFNAVISAAGIWDMRDDRHSHVDLGLWERTWRINVTGTMLTLRNFEPRMAEGSCFVTFGSVAALAGMPKRDAYTASKGAVVALSRAWAADLIRKRIRVNCVCPGPTATAMTAEVLTQSDLNLPLGRAAHADEVAAVVASIVSPEMSYLSGAILPIDGGLTATMPNVPLVPRK